MITHDLIQGSPSWVAFRFEHFGASEAAAMLGLSTKMTRTELLHMKHVGSQKEFSNYVQERILNNGHRVEALARPILAKRIGEKLYPVTCSEGKLSASCDGLTMGEDIAFEHKQWNQALAEAVAAGELPEEYWPQCQQVLMVTKAEKLIFVVSDGTEENFLSLEVIPDPAWFDRIVKGWDQFERDLAAYVPAAVEVKAVGATPETLPALRVELTGEVTTSNLVEYKNHALAVIGAINRNLQTDQDFADASKAVKWCGEVETRLESVKEHALSQTKSIDELFKAIDDIKAKCKETRLDLGKLVDRRNTERKEEIVLGGKTAYQAHLDGLKQETEGLWVALPTPDFAASIKGMRLFSNMQDAVNTLLANSKITADDSAKKIRGNLALLAEAKDHAFLFNDRAALIAKAPDDLKLLIQSRIDAHKAAKAAEEEATRERIRTEEQAKAEKDAREKLAAEQAEAAKAERDRVAAEAAKVERIVTAPDVAPSTPPGPAAAAITHAQVVQHMPATVRQAMAPKPAAKPETPPTLTLGEISTRLSFNVTSAFLATLGFEATTVKAAKLYHEGDFKPICEAIKTHISEVQDQFEPATA